MGFSKLHKLVAYLLSGLGLFGLTLGEEITPLATGLIALAFAASWFAEGPRIMTPGYGSAWTAIVVFGLMLQIARAVLDEPTLALAIEFAAFLQISRLFTRRTGVDYQQIAVLAFVHLVAATVLSTNLSYGVMFIGFVIATPWMLALSHLRREIEGNYTPAPAVAGQDAQTALARVLASRRVIGPRFLLGTAFLSVPLFAMTLSIFIVIPRVGKGFLSFRRDGGQKVAGFGNQVELGGFGVIRDDPTVVVRVTPPLVDEKAPRLSLRLRGTSFDHYDGKRWTRSPGQTEQLHTTRTTRDLFALWREPIERRDIEYQIVLEHLDEPVVFLPEGTVALSVPPRQERGQPVLRKLSYGAGLDIRYDADGAGLVYSAWIDERNPSRALGALLPERMRPYLQVPESHERIAALAREVAGDSKDPEEITQRVLRFLGRGTYRYSLEQPNVGDLPPLEAFLLEAKSGHCEYFSSAMAIMLRTLGIPTRNVTGFVGGRFNPYGRYYALRQGDAHSWVEVYIEGRGWVTVDPTPPGRAQVGPRVGLWSDVSALIDAMRTRWMTSVVGYDLRTQVGILKRIGHWLSTHQPQLDQGGEDGEGDGADMRAWLARAGRALGAVIAVLLAAFGVWLWRRRKSASTKPQSAEQLAAVRLYRDLERALTKQGHARPSAVTPLEHARLLSERGVPYSEDIASVTKRYVEARYGERPLSTQELVALKAVVERVRSAPPRVQR